MLYKICAFLILIAIVLFIVITTTPLKPVCCGKIYTATDYNAATRTYDTTEICVKDGVIIGFEK